MVTPVGKPTGQVQSPVVGGNKPTGPADKQVILDEKQAEDRYQAQGGEPGKDYVGSPPVSKDLVDKANEVKPPVEKVAPPGPPLLREADADDFAKALFGVIMPLPSPKQYEVERLFLAFMDYALRGASSFADARRKRFS